MWFARLLALLVLAPLSALADEAVAPWGDVEIPYDTAAWRVAASAGDDSVIILTCIAADCPEDAQLFGSIAAPNGDVEEPAWRAPRPIPLNSPALPFLAYDLWSGCRARDAPILSAAVVFRERLYRLVTAPGAGCNFGPQLPLSRFTDLVEGIRPAETAGFRVGGIQITYDPRRWQVAVDANGADPRRARMTCTLRECRDPNGKQAFVRVFAAPEGSVQCPAKSESEGTVKEREGLIFGGLPMRLWNSFSGCRAHTPVQRNACGIQLGLVYRFVSGAHWGCGGVEGVSEALFDEVLAGISLAREMPARP